MKHSEHHYSHRIGWLRAAVFGTNDGLVSTASLIVGVAAADTARPEIIIAGIAGLVAGAMSMAAGEYVSVSSQADTEKADLKKEEYELDKNPKLELNELKMSFVKRGVSDKTALEVAEQLTATDALGAHAREELGITEITTAQPLQAAITSAVTFAIGGALPLICVLLMSITFIPYGVSASTMVFLALLGAVGAKLGGANITRGVLRVTFWGAAAMAFTALIGYIFGVSLS
jgi:VIT1/CCC1 family predicted Fe2+/Mn2+ transporter